MSAAYLHVPGEDLTLLWIADPSISLPIGAAAAGYALALASARGRGSRTPSARRIVSFYVGLAAIAFALLGPLEHLGGERFSAHMAQHLLLTLVGPPLIFLGRPFEVTLSGLPPAAARALLRATVKRARAREVLAAVGHPVTAFAAYNLSLLAWHAPAAYQAAVASPSLHALEHALFLITSCLFWWLLTDPYPRRFRPSVSAAAILLFGTWMLGDLLGATITLAPDVLYPIYDQPGRAIEVSAIADQRLGGLLMWAAGGVLFAVLLVGRIACSLRQVEPAGTAVIAHQGGE
jgi:cytochrome c oxidase assembly factor CtaG